AAQAIPDGQARAQALAAVSQAEAQYEAASAQARASVEQFNAGLAGLSSALSSLSRAQRVQTTAALAAARRTVDALTVRAPLDGVVSLGRSGGGGGGGGVPGGVLDALPPEVAGQAQDLAGGAAGGAAPSSSAALAQGVPVTSGEVLATVTDTSVLGLLAEVDETDVLLVDPGVTAQVELDAVPGSSYPGEVRSVDLAPTTSTGGGVTYRVRLSLEPGTTLTGGAAPSPRPGMSAIVDLRVRTAEQAVSVPASAVVRDLRRDSVWAVEDGVASRRTVRLGAQGLARVQVLHGLEVGERVVVRGADVVSDGQDVP
ncbi:MAG: efflux RND transporter periplasmic adaptor subunit, partial [Actinomycetes bacterium]